MKRKFFAVAIIASAIFLRVPESRADTPATIVKPEDYSVSLDLKFSKKRPNTLQRLFSFLDYGPNGFATGFVVGDGLVMTAYHAVSGNLSESKKVQLGFAPTDELEVQVYVKGCHAKVIKIDADADLALLSICSSQRRAKAPAFQRRLRKDEKRLLIARAHGK